MAWRDGRVEDVVDHANNALELWRSTWHVYFFKGLCLWPLMSVQLESGDIAAAVEAACEMLEPSQVRLPDDLEAPYFGSQGSMGPGRSCDHCRSNSPTRCNWHANLATHEPTHWPSRSP